MLFNGLTGIWISRVSSSLFGLLALVEEQLREPVGGPGGVAATAVGLVKCHSQLFVFLLLRIVSLQPGRVPGSFMLGQRSHRHAPDRVVGLRRGRRTRFVFFRILLP